MECVPCTFNLAGTLAFQHSSSVITLPDLNHSQCPPSRPPLKPSQLRLQQLSKNDQLFMNHHELGNIESSERKLAALPRLTAELPNDPISIAPGIGLPQPVGVHFSHFRIDQWTI